MVFTILKEQKLPKLLPLWKIQLRVTESSKLLAERGMAGWTWHDCMNLSSLGNQMIKNTDFPEEAMRIFLQEHDIFLQLGPTPL